VITLDFLAELSALAYLLVLGVAAGDVVFPVLPSESVVILGGVLAAQDRLHPVPLFAAAAGGAIIGDHLSYGIGRWTTRGQPKGRTKDVDRKGRVSKAARLQAWAAAQLDKRGPVVLVVARFVPGGRTASTFVAGRTAYPLTRFSPATVLAGMLWAGFAVTFGYLGGAAFHDQTLLATGCGILLALAFGGLIELVTRRFRKNDAGAVGDDSADGLDELAA
jgi:membrane-associated protein